MISCLDKLVSVYILWFCFFAVAQLGNQLLLFCYHSFRIFIMHQQTFLYSATSVAEFFHLRNILLPQWQNFSHLRIIQLLCYPSGRIFLIWELFSYSATSVAEFFSSEKYSAILLICYLSGRIFLICETLTTILLLCSHLNSSNFYSVSAITVNEISVNFEF